LAGRLGHGSLSRVTALNLYRGFRFPTKVTHDAVLLNYCIGQNLRDNEPILDTRGTLVSYESFRGWDLRFGQLSAAESLSQ